VRVAIATKFACGLSWWLRLKAEGNEVCVWVEPRSEAQVADGLINKVDSFHALMYWAKAGVMGNIPTIMLFDSSGLGKYADEARKWGIPVVGGGKFCDKLEHDRGYGFDVAEQIGCKLPPHEMFDSFSEALDFVRGMDDMPMYFKSDSYLDSDATFGADSSEEMVEYLEYLIRDYGDKGSCIIQEKIEGVPLSTARWWNGRAWVGPYQSTLEHKKFMNDDLGPSTGCSMNAVWFYKDTPKVATEIGWESLTSTFLREEAPPGIYDINTIATKKGEVYFLEWTPRLGYDSEMTSGRLFPSLSEMLFNVTFGMGEIHPSFELAYAVRIGTPPYPWEHSNPSDTKTCLGRYVSGEVGDLYSDPFIGYQLKLDEHGLSMGSTAGIVGLTYASGGPLTELEEKVTDAAKEVRVAGKSYRTDGAKTLSKDAKEMRKAGFEIHPDLVK